MAFHMSVRVPSLIDCLDVSDDDHVLIIGAESPDLMCALLRRGCGAVMAMRAKDGVRPEPADLVLVPDAGDIAAALPLARRALAPNAGAGGRLVLRLPDATLPRAVAAALRAHGFGKPRQTPLPEGLVLTAELPWFWTPRPASTVAARAL